MSWYEENKPRWREYARRYRARYPERVRAERECHQRQRRAFLDWLKSVPCLDCGIEYPPFCMDFDHRDPATKTSEPGLLYRRRLDLLQSELVKCDVVCANCHRRRTHGARRVVQ